MYHYGNVLRIQSEHLSNRFIVNLTDVTYFNKMIAAPEGTYLVFTSIIRSLGYCFSIRLRQRSFVFNVLDILRFTESFVNCPLSTRKKYLLHFGTR